MAVEIPFVPAAPAEAQAGALTFAKFTDVAGDFAVNLTLAAVILVASWYISKWAATLVSRGLSRLRVFQRDQTLQQFACELTRWVVFIIGLIAVLQRLGVQTASIIAVLGAASLAIGLALQGALSNVAAGVLMVILRPYRVGDEVEIAGQAGIVKRLDLFTTDIATFDNQRIVVPNSKVMGEVLVNRTYYRTRRVELDFDVAYEEKLDEVFRIMKETAAADPRVQAEPAPWAGVAQLKDWSVLVRLRAWVKTPDYIQTGYDLRKAVKEAFDAAQIEMPYPHQVSVLARERPDPGAPTEEPRTWQAEAGRPSGRA
jgi:small conductance mechanosensitive channel